MNVRRYAFWGLLGLVLLIVLGFVVSAIFFSTHFAAQGFMPLNSSYSDHFAFAPYHAAFFFLPVLFFGGLVFLLIMAALGWLFFSRRRVWNERFNVSRFDPALQALRERYAKGEITKEQFDEMSKDLDQHQSET